MYYSIKKYSKDINELSKAKAYFSSLYFKNIIPFNIIPFNERLIRKINSQCLEKVQYILTNHLI